MRDADPIPLVTRNDDAAGSGNVVAENIAALKALFPSIVTDGQVDFEVLRQLLGDSVEEGEERYGLNWRGKRRARAFALTPTLATLRPVKDDSKDWDTTKNIVIEGDNLEVLKCLRRSYAGQVKLIYIDPPYNTGNDFVYPDDYADSLGNYERLTGQRGADGAALTTNKEASGRFHTDWLNMMYPRLMLAKELLRDDGVIMISHDDHERDAILSMSRDLFGNEAELACLIWNKQHSQQQGVFKRYHEYISVIARKEGGVEAITGGEGDIEAGALKKISRANPASDFEFPAGVRFDAKDGTVLSGTFGDSEQVTVVAGRLVAQGGRTAEPVTLSAGWTQRNQMVSWFAGQETIDSRGQKVLEFYLNSAGKLKCRKERGRITPPTLLPEYGMVSAQTEALTMLMGATVFDTPKPVEMLQDFVSWFAKPNDLVLDFFAGSGTTGHAVMAQNAADGGKRRSILVQLPERLDPANPAQKTAADYCDDLGVPRTIAELTKERLRRAGAKVKADKPVENIDTGFRVYKLATSNLKPWQPDSDNLAQSLLDAVDNVLPGRSEDDLLVELLLKTGIDLTLPMQTRTICQRPVYALGGGVLIVYLGNVSDADAEEVGQGIADWHAELDPVRNTTFYFRDTGFATAAAKANIAAIIRQRVGSRVEKLASI